MESLVPALLGLWSALVVGSLLALALDLRRRNPQIQGLMRCVWQLTVLYAGPVGLALYGATGRAQISRDSIWRRGGRSRTPSPAKRRASP